MAASLSSSSSSSSSLSALSAAQQNQLVVQLIHDAEAASTAAKRVAAAAHDKLRKLERAWEKLSAAQIELHQQSRDSESSLRELHTRAAELDAQAERLRTEFNAQKDELQRILDNLAARPLADCLQAHSPTPPPLPVPPADVSVPPPSSLSRASSQPPAPLQTLFDFVDVDSVNLVHSAFLQCMADVARLSELSRSDVLAKPEQLMAAVRDMESALTDKMSAGTGGAAESVAANMPALTSAPAHSSAASLSSAASASNAAYLAASAADPSVVGQCRAAYSALEAEVAAIPELFSAMCRSYDRVRQARQAAAANAQSAAAAASVPASTAAATAAASDVLCEISEMQHLLQQIHVRSARASALLHHMDSCNSVHSALYQNTLELYQHLERLGPALATAVASFQSLSLHHSSLVHSALTSVQELHNLSLFYRHFERAYEALLDEMQRRHRAAAAHTALITHVRAQLSEAHQAEMADRELFQAHFGKYLPPSLCPAIFEPATEYTVYPLSEPQTELPVYVPSHDEMERATQRREAEQQQQQQQQQQPQLDQSQPPPPASSFGLGLGLGLSFAPTAHPPAPAVTSASHASASASASTHPSLLPSEPDAHDGGLPPSSELLHSATQPGPASASSAAAAAASGSIGPVHPVGPSVQSHPRPLGQPAPSVTRPVAPKGFGDDD